MLNFIALEISQFGDGYLYASCSIHLLDLDIALNDCDIEISHDEEKENTFSLTFPKSIHFFNKHLEEEIKKSVFLKLKESLDHIEKTNLILENYCKTII